jgi:hypothetical protein
MSFFISGIVEPLLRNIENDILIKQKTSAIYK